MRLFICILSFLWLSAVTAESHDDVGSNTELRLRKLENTLNSLDPLQLLNQIENYNLRLNELQGEVELLQHQIKRQNAQIQNLKSALQSVNANISNLQNKTNDSDTESVPEPDTDTVETDNSTNNEAPQITETNAEGKEQYQAAFGLLKESRYQESIQAFEQFLQDYPNSDYADKAQYWIAETYYIQQDYNNAIASYQTHLEAYPQSPKRSQSTLKLAYSNLEIGQIQTATDLLEQILDEFPGSTAARSATKTIRDLSVEQNQTQ